jgi:cytidine deaminase
LENKALMTLTQEQAEILLNQARLAAENAYAPYSDFPVGAALLSESGEVICGVNVENISFGLTLCAERTALVNAISDGQRNFKAIAVWASRRPNGSVAPCGACRQVMAEFLKPETPVVMSHCETGQVRILTMQALLPEAFGPTPGSKI